MFTQDYTEDFEAILTSRRPFALVRFGDGEMALLDGKPHKSADAWSVTTASWLRHELMDSLRANIDGLCIGLPPPCCFKTGPRLRSVVRAPIYRQTFATLFIHGNLEKAHRLRDRFSDAVIVSSAYGDIRVPADGVSKRWDLDDIVRQLLEVNKPILLAAGPCSNVIALRYWQLQALHKRQTIIDVGSALDVMHGIVSRRYHGTMNEHFCAWHEADGAHRRRHAPATMQPVVPVANVPQRIRIGKRATTPMRHAQIQAPAPAVVPQALPTVTGPAPAPAPVATPAPAPAATGLERYVPPRPDELAVRISIGAVPEVVEVTEVAPAPVEAPSPKDAGSSDTVWDGPVVVDAAESVTEAPIAETQIPEEEREGRPRPAEDPRLQLESDGVHSAYAHVHEGNRPLSPTQRPSIRVTTDEASIRRHGPREHVRLGRRDGDIKIGTKK